MIVQRPIRDIDKINIGRGRARNPDMFWWQPSKSTSLIGVMLHDMVFEKLVEPCELDLR
jgi:tRNA U34 5-carboxymethylaminomethyl modifying enzyme MnmG/GidA